MTFPRFSKHFLVLLAVAITGIIGGAHQAHAERLFVFGKRDFSVESIAVDDEGSTYLLGKRTSNGRLAVLRYGPEGALREWPGGNFIQEVIVDGGSVTESPTGIISVGEANESRLFITTSRRVIKLDANTGLADGPSLVMEPNVRIADVEFNPTNGRVYICGTLSGVGSITFPGSAGVVATSLAHESGFIAKIPQSMSGVTAVVAITHSWSGMRLRGLTVDDAGSVYACGRGGGTFFNAWFILFNLAVLGHEDVGPIVVKYDRDLTDVQAVSQGDYVDSIFGTSYNDLVYSEGFIYAAGKINTGLIYQKFDAALNKSKAATVTSSGVGGSANSIATDGRGNIYVTATAGPNTSTLNGAAQSDFAEVSSSLSNTPYFCKLNEEMKFQWVVQPTRVGSAFPAQRLPVAWNPRNQIAFWAGSFTGSLELGDDDLQAEVQEQPSTGDPVPIGAGHFLAALTEDGNYQRIVRLSIYSDFGGDRIVPFGAPAATDPVSRATIDNTRFILKGTPVTISAPEFIYLNIKGEDITSSVESDPEKIDREAEQRIAFTSLTVNDVVQDGQSPNYTFELQSDSEISINWDVEYALRIFFDTREASSPDGFVGTLESDAAGDPIPEVKKHWIERDANVVAEIEGIAPDLLSHPGLNIRYLMTGYYGYGSAYPGQLDPSDPTETSFLSVSEAVVTDSVKRRFLLQSASSDNPPVVPETVTGQDSLDPDGDGRLEPFVRFRPFLQPFEERQAVPEFTMSQPSGIYYKWQLQYGVQLSTTGADSANFPLVRVDPSWNGPVYPGRNTPGIGSGVHWYDIGIPVVIGTQRSSETLPPKVVMGWTFGDGEIFPDSGDFGGSSDVAYSDAGPIPAGGASTHVGLFPNIDAADPKALLRPARATFLYDDDLSFEQAFVGQPIKFNKRMGPTNPLGNPFGIDFLEEPDSVDVLIPSGAAKADMVIWDDAAKHFLPLRPGAIIIRWVDPLSGTEYKNQVQIDYAEPNYRHIAKTPGVRLDVDPDDEFIFKEVRYTESGGAVTSEGLFTAESSGNTVLLFGRISEDSRGVPKEFLEVKVVRTLLWDEELVEAGNSLIGSKITSLYDREKDPRWNLGFDPSSDSPNGYDGAGLGTGYLFFERARYNAFIYDRGAFEDLRLSSRPGPVIPVNLLAPRREEEELVVIWYDNPDLNDKILWPHQATLHTAKWPTVQSEGLDRIVISSRFGSESVDGNDVNQLVMPANDPVVGLAGEVTYNPGRFQEVQIYSQPDRERAGYNPNEEHALVAPSFRFSSASPKPKAAYALRLGDLNVYDRTGVTTTDPASGLEVFNPEVPSATVSGLAAINDENTQPSNYTSHPFVLVQFFDSAAGEYRMKVYKVERNDPVIYPDFTQEMEAGKPVLPYYPLPLVIGAAPCLGTYGRELDTDRRVRFRDHKGTFWAVSGEDSNNDPGMFEMYFFYPLAPDFWWPNNALEPGSHVAWLHKDRGYAQDRFNIDYREVDQVPNSQAVTYETVWPKNLPVLKVGETLTFQGGEYREDNPQTPVRNDQGDIVFEETPGLPGVLGMAAGEIVFDNLNPNMDPAKLTTDYTARVYQALEQRSVELPFESFPTELQPANGRIQVRGVLWFFNDLSASLQKRVFYDPLLQKLGIKGFLNDKDIGEPTLTAAPPAVYVLEPSILTVTELEELRGISDNAIWQDAVDDLYNLTRNPNRLDLDGNNRPDDAFLVGLEQKIQRDSEGDPLIDVGPTGIESIIRDGTTPAPLKALGVGLAVTANPGFLDPLQDLPAVSYVTIAENNDESLGGSPVVMHVIKVDREERYRGAIKTVLSDNVFDENIILRHTGDFATNARDLVFEWWYRPEDGTEALPPDAIPAGQTNPWKLFANQMPEPGSIHPGQNFFQFTLVGNPSAPEALLADTLWFVRYRHKNENPSDQIKWDPPSFQWAGAGNSTPIDMDGDGLPDYRAQLVEGWIKRVLDAINPFEARIRDFTGNAPAAYSDIIRQLGQAYVGAVPFNPAQNVIENVGLIELYETVLRRGQDLSINQTPPFTTPAIANALQLVSTRISDFYMLLGNEAYSDALDPTIGVDGGSVSPVVHAFQNQVADLNEEELSLLRGVDFFFARPVYNRLFWNFTQGEAEAAYAINYNITDVNRDGFINEDDSMIMFPQGHGDAWGHYLSSVNLQYDLLTHPEFEWQPRSEFVNVQDIVVPVDFLDERKFAEAAAAKAQTGAQIVQATYRSRYVEDPTSQWQGYTDTDPEGTRAWGVQGWSRRAGQGALFDWVTANALLPAVHPNENLEGIAKVDRTTVKDIQTISANLNQIQQTFDDANNGVNPLGIAGNTVPFDINPDIIGRNFTGANTHFDQVYARAVTALGHANSIWQHANQLNNRLRNIGNTEADFLQSTFEKDLTFRNRLIDIFGQPYEGTIGSGKPYPPGYLGPDLMLHMYVNVQGINETTVPQPTLSFADLDAETGAIFDVVRNGEGSDVGVFDLSTVRNDFRSSFAESFSGNLSDWFPSFTDVNYTSFGVGDTPRVPLENMNLPTTTRGYTFQAPDEWGQRISVGKLQSKLNALLVQEANVAKAIADWDGLQGGILREIRLINASVELDSNLRVQIAAQEIINSVANAAILALDITSDTTDTAISALDDVGETIDAAIPTHLPTAGLSVSPGDALSAARGASGATVAGTTVGLRTTKLIVDSVSRGTAFARDLSNLIFQLAIDNQERDFALRQQLVNLENLVGDEAIKRVEVFRQQELMRQLSDEYRSIVQQGARLLDEREAFNKKVAGMAQRNRFSDMTFRVSRNAALEKYYAAFELAAQYSYLAAKAYDYETNLDPSDGGSAESVLTEIVRTRTLGRMAGGAPQLGGGLAGSLAWMKTNFESFRGQLGFNNPQTETGRMSLRHELYRLKDESNTTWASDVLEANRVDNLWDVPEFRRYCRPFSAFDPDVPEPGIVITFQTNILSGKNFFGQDLGPQDHAYDPSNFATKIRSVGVWFAGSEDQEGAEIPLALPETPRVYLIPAGTEYLTIPNSDDLELRAWNILDQKIPAPLPGLQADLNDPSWRPIQMLEDLYGETRRFSSFRAYHDSGFFDEGDMTYDSRLVGRSVWNSQWLLIIPGSSLNSVPETGLDNFIYGPDGDSENPLGVSDIRIFFQTYGYSGG